MSVEDQVDFYQQRIRARIKNIQELIEEIVQLNENEEI